MSQNRLSCADVEIMLADYVDQTLLDRDMADLKAHLAGCDNCRELAADATAAVQFVERAAVVEPPPELINKILFEIGQGAPVKTPLRERLFGGWLSGLLQPRFAMGMAMTMLSFGMLLGIVRIQDNKSMTPTRLYTAAQDKVARAWDRSVKYYQNLKVVFEIQSRYQEWAAEQEQARPNQPGQQPKGQQ
jgi:anti-sigma factor RsiW